MNFKFLRTGLRRGCDRSSSAFAAQAADISGAGATFPYPDLRKMGATSYKNEDRQQSELSVDRLGRRHQADQGQDGDFRRVRRAAGARGLSTRPASLQWPMVIGGDRAGRQPIDGVKPRRARARRPDARARSILGKITKWDDPAIAQLNPSRETCRSAPIVDRAPLRRLRHDLHLHQLSVAKSRPTGSRKVGDEHRGRMAGRASAPRAMRASPTTSPQTKGSIGYVEYAYAKQNKIDFDEA